MHEPIKDVRLTGQGDHPGPGAEVEKLKEALRDIEERYKTLTENIAVGIFRSTPGARGKFLEVNPAFQEMLGYADKNELLEEDVSQLYQNPEERLRFSEKILKNGFVKNEELLLRKKDGTPIIVSETAIAVTGENGKKAFFYGIVEEITERKRTEDELCLQKTYLERLFNSAPEAIALHDNNDLIVDVNDEFIKMFGFSREEAVGKPINSLIVPETHLDEAVSISRKVIRGEKVEIETIRKDKEGKLINVSILGAPIVHSGRQIGDYAIYRDITGRKKADEDLRMQKTYLERLFNSAPEAIVFHDNDDLIINVNDEFTKMFGYSREEVIGKPINGIVVPAGYESEANLFSNDVTHGKRVGADSKRKRKNGDLIDVSILGAPIMDGGKQVGVYAIYRDITERKKAEEEILIQKIYLEKLLNSAPEAILLHDINDIVMDVNVEFTRVFGYSRGEAVGKRVNDLVASEEFREEAALLSQKSLNGERVEVDSKRKRKDNTLIDVSILGAPIFYGDKQMGVYAIYRDITERKKAEEIRIRSREESRMARNIQMNFLPKSNPSVPGYDIAGKSIPALNVGGDYYDFIHLDDHRIAISLGDVSGNGLAASLVMANLQATIRGQAMFDADPKKCLERANILLYGSTDARTFISLFYGILDVRNHTLIYANAGQDLPIIFSPDNKSTLLRTRGMALGVKEYVKYEKEEIPIGPDDCLLIYSDGIPEAMDDGKEEFGEAKLRGLIQNNLGKSSAELVESVFASVIEYTDKETQDDDMTIVLLKRKGY